MQLQRAGTEFLVDTNTGGDQVSPAITHLANGGFVVAWEDNSGTLGDSSGTSIKAQLYDSTGAQVGSEFLVNTITAGNQVDPTITQLANGGFVVSWQDASGMLGDTSGYGIAAQVFDATGAKVGSEFLVNTNTYGEQRRPAVTALLNGGFVIAWDDGSGTLGDNSGASIKAQVFSATGAAVGSEFLVNTTTANFQEFPAITSLSNGGFVVTWDDLSSSPSLGTGAQDVRGQIFSASGAKVGAEFLVNTITAGVQYQSTVTALANGGFVVSWQDNSGSLGDSSGYGIAAQVYDAAGAKVGSEVLVNTNTFGDQGSPTITSLASGGFVVSWRDASGTLGDTSGTSIKAQLFDAHGTQIGSEFLVNTNTAGDQLYPAITQLANGDLVATWQDASGTLGDSSGTSIKAQVFHLTGQTLTGAAEAGSTIIVYDGTTKLGTTIAGTNGTWSYTLGALLNGAHSLTATATDAAGNVGAASSALTFTVDTVAPNAPMGLADSGIVNGWVNAMHDTMSQTLTGTAEASSTVTVYDGTTKLGTTTAAASGTWSYTLGVLTNGPHSLTAIATDAAGNTGGSSSALSFKVDTIPPTPPANLSDTSIINGYVNALHDTSAQTLTGAAEAGALVTIFDGTAQLGTATASSNGSWNYTLGVLSDGLHSLSATATDPAGNVGTSSAAVSFTVDTVPPPLPKMMNYSVSTTASTLTGTSEAGSTVRVFDGATLVGTALTPSTGIWTLSVAPLSDTTHNLSMQAIDPAGNVTASVGDNLIGSTKVDTLTANATTDDFIWGGSGSDVLVGGAGNDRIIGGPGNDTMTGGMGADVFVFGPGFGNDVITDFTPGTDHLELSRALFTSGWSDSQIYNYIVSHSSAQGRDLILQIDHTDTITLHQVTLTSLHQTDFIFTG